MKIKQRHGTLRQYHQKIFEEKTRLRFGEIQDRMKVPFTKLEYFEGSYNHI